jgi:DDE superfamily endonuclease
MLCVPSAAAPLLLSFSVAFSRPTFQRVLLLILGAVVTPGRRTVAAVLRTMRPVARGHFSSYHRVLSAARWSLWAAGRVLARAVLSHVPEGQPVVLAVDDTVARHRGAKVYGRGCHRDPIRSSHGITVRCRGHRWVVLAVMVRFPFASRPWALPVLAALFRNRELCDRQGRRFKSWPQLARQLLAVMIHWFPARRFILLGDGGFATHELAWFCHRHRRHVTFVFRFYDDACLYSLPPARQRRGRGRGRPAKRGKRLPAPGRAVAAAQRLARAAVDWYGGSRRDVQLLGAAGGWYRDGRGLVPLRWVFVRDREGTHRDEYFAATDPALRPEQVVGLYTARWPIETTFQQAREHLGLETPRHRCERSVLRTTPCLLGLFSVVCLVFAAHAGRRRVRPVNAAPWYAKAEPTFSDAVATVRRLVWDETIIRPRCRRPGQEKWPTPLRELLLDCLARAA